jgi:prolyl-tRNA editing enzyme YbaK/EbsC (Cys-tRNA(Pro) deacylase)
VPETPLPTPTQRVIDAASRKGVTLDVHIFTESTHTAEDAAAAVGAALGQIVKSLVFVAPRTDGGLEPILCLVSGPNRVDVARLAAVTGEPDVRRATAVEARDLTGYTIGGIPPVGFSRPLRVVMDPDLGRFQVVWAAAGTATAVFPVAPATLRMLSNAHVAPICEERRQADVLAEGVGLPGAGLETAGLESAGLESASLDSAGLEVKVPRATAPGDPALPQPGGGA